MAHPKSRISKTRKRKRRTHKKITAPQVSICKTTGEAHQFHRTYEVDGNLYYRGKLFAQTEVEEV
ncbi:UNVERIFIED_CONTAM: hypothetical protein GTU68_006969 [Idotea baltica]|nr:hypothetical protein [Idotea baltica]